MNAYTALISKLM